MLVDALDRFASDIFKKIKQATLAKAFETISSRYQKGEGNFLQTEEERIAYLFTRMPGTHGAITKALLEMSKRVRAPISSLLDVGAGSGSGMWAAHELFPSIKSMTLLERDQEFMRLGKKLASYSPILAGARWIAKDLEKELALEGAFDLVLASYSLGELKETALPALLQTLLSLTKEALVVVEPGTPKGYQRLMLIRDILLQVGGELLAPCPHAKKCPLTANDWCHFFARVPRSQVHRKLKSGALGYEDEKFCYLVFGKQKGERAKSRILRHPAKRPGHLQLTLCSEGGLSSKVLSKKDKEAYKEAKRLAWGDAFTG